MASFLRLSLEESIIEGRATENNTIRFHIPEKVITKAYFHPDNIFKKDEVVIVRCHGNWVYGKCVEEKNFPLCIVEIPGSSGTYTYNIDNIGKFPKKSTE